MSNNSNHTKMNQLQHFWIALIAFGTITLNSLGAISFSINRFGDVLVQNDGKTFQCDRIICPKETVRCEVSKYPDEADSNFTVRKDVCYGPKNDVLLVEMSRAPVVPGQTQLLHVVVTDDGVSTSSIVSSGSSQGSAVIDGEALQQNIQENVEKAISDGDALRQKIEENVQKQLEELNKTLEERLGALWQGFN